MNDLREKLVCTSQDSKDDEKSFNLKVIFMSKRCMLGLLTKNKWFYDYKEKEAKRTETKKDKVADERKKSTLQVTLELPKGLPSIAAQWH